MTYSGHVQNGVIVLDGQPVLPDGAVVRVELVEATAPPDMGEHEPPLGQVLLRLAGQAIGLPADAASNHDAYLTDQIP